MAQTAHSSLAILDASRRPQPLRALLAPQAAAGDLATRRSKLWELSSHLHCSVIGTCLSTAELRQVLAKTGLDLAGMSEHQLHGQGVSLAGRHDRAAKLLTKALDQRHRQAIRQFDKATSATELRALWRAAVEAGEIPGAYWAALTHPAADSALIREVFGEVHMLSHLVGAANRADIRRLSRLEAERAALEAKLQRQQGQLREAVLSRDATIAELKRLLADRSAGEAPAPVEADERATLAGLIAGLERRLAAEIRRREAADARAERCRAERDDERHRCLAAEAREQSLRMELDAVEAGLAAPEPDAAGAPQSAMLNGLALLYVGGRPRQVDRLRALAERAGGDLLHHDGGVEENGGLIAGLVHRADAVLFPVDCISHDAMAAVKRLCRQAGKPFLPLRSAGVGSFLAALGRAEITGLAAARG